MKLLVLTSSTGGGHDLRARAFCAWAAQESDLGISTSTYKPLENSTVLNRFGVDLYNGIQRHLPVAHHAYWSFLELAGLHRRPWQLSGIQPFVELLEDERPDFVLSVHAHLNHGYMALVRRVLGPDKVKVGTYCGELAGGYGFSRHWVNPDADLFIGATAACCQAAKRIGMPDKRNFQGGFMLRPESYTEPLTSAERTETLRSRFDLDGARPTLLLATGAVGANNHRRLLNALDSAQLDLQVIALCGKRPEALAEITAWRPRSSQLCLRAVPYIEDMPRLLGAVSALVARGGTGTTSEAILSGCPLIVNGLGGVMPQEMITVKYLKSQGIHTIIHRSRDLPGQLAPILASTTTLAAARTCMHKAQPPGTPRAILQRLLNT